MAAGAPGSNSCYAWCAQLLHQCAKRKSLRAGRCVHARILRLTLASHAFIQNHIINMYGKCWNAEDARQVFDRMRDADKNVVSYTAMLSAYAQNFESGKEALEILQAMHRSGTSMNEYAYSTFLGRCCSSVSEGEQIHGHAFKGGYADNVFVGSSLIHMYSQVGGCCRRAWQVFQNLLPTGDHVVWSAMIAAFAHCNRFVDALRLFCRMLAHDDDDDDDDGELGLPLLLDRSCACTALAAAGGLAQPLVGRQFHCLIVKSGLDWDGSVMNALVDMYSKCGCMENAGQAFRSMERRGVIAWTALMAGHVQVDCAEEAFKLYIEGQRQGLKPNQYTYSTLLKGCALQATLHQGMQIYCHVIKSGFESEDFVGCSLIDMFGKCGWIDVAFRIFREMKSLTAVSWSAMIGAYSQNGHAKEAIQLFKEMRQASIKPSEITFVSILSVCSHSGLLEEGFYFFDLMSKHYGMEPNRQHYACMVDLLCRAGYLAKARLLMEEMPFEPIVSMWGSLLAGSRMHSNTEMGKLAAQ